MDIEDGMNLGSHHWRGPVYWVPPLCQLDHTRHLTSSVWRVVRRVVRRSREGKAIIWGEHSNPFFLCIIISKRGPPLKISRLTFINVVIAFLSKLCQPIYTIVHETRSNGSTDCGARGGTKLWRQTPFAQTKASLASNKLATGIFWGDYGTHQF